MALIELNKISKVYRTGRGGLGFHLGSDEEIKNKRVLQEIDLSIEPGQSVGILGRSGAGKSTLGKLICSLEMPTSGSLKIHGQQVIKNGLAVKWRRSAELKKERAGFAQMIWQDAPGSMNPRLRVEEIIAEPLRVRKILGKEQIRPAITKLMNEVSLPNGLRTRYSHELSGGEAQRVVIARALALSPELLVCDEPASALDIGAKVQIADLLQHLRKERGMALLLIAHDLKLIRKLTDQLMVLEDGRVVEEGPTSMLLETPSHACTREILDAEPVLFRKSRGTHKAFEPGVRPHLYGD